MSPERRRAEPSGGGVFQVRRVPLADAVTAYRFTYEEDFVDADGEILQFALVAPLLFRARGKRKLDEVAMLDETFLTVNSGNEAFQIIVEGRPLSRYGSCTYSSLLLFDVVAEFEGGGSIGLEERFREADSVLHTGPAALVSATVELEGETRVVSDYWSLVYSASRHNRWVRYGVVLDPPQRLAGLECPVRVVELGAPEPFDGSRAGVRLLDEDFEPLASPRVTAYTKTERPAEDVPFQRGDVTGDGRWNLIDVVTLVEYRFTRDEEPACLKSADVDDDGTVNLADVLALVDFLFRRGEAPSAPFEQCALDLTEDALNCAAFPECRP